tara:strand:- start:220 stop:816 length:597 start_codon:yes stop_codon:yes gene_type:complete
MFAVVEDGKITSMPKGNKGITIGDIKHPASIFSLWTEAQRNAIGVYTVEIDETNKKDEEWYVNTAITYTFGSGKVTGAYGTATAKAIADSDATDSEGNKLKDANGNQLINKGLKTIKKEDINNQCASLLAPSDWMVVRATETETTMDSGWKTWRASVRTKCNSMQTQIDNASDIDALAALFVYNAEGVRPLGEFPIKE